MTSRSISRSFVAAVLSLPLAAQVFAQGAAPAPFQDGIHFTTIEGAPVTQGAQVEVVEAFSYMCNHCATFEPYITNWKARMPEDVVFKRIPVVFGRSSWELYARAYVTAEMMGIADQAHGPLMDKLWKEKEILRSMEELAGFYAGHGVTAADFLATSKSFAVDAKLRRDQRALQTADVRGTPSLIVNGKYLVASNTAVANFDMMLDVVDFLVASERDKRPAAAAAEAGSGTAADAAPEAAAAAAEG